MAQTTIKTEQLADDAVTSAKLDTNIAIAGTLGVASDVTLTSATSTKPHLIIKNTNADGGAPQLQFIKDSSSPADNDEIGRIYMYGDDDAGNPYEGVLIRGIATDVSNGSEDTTLEFFTQKAGSQASTLALASGNVGIGTVPSTKLHLGGTAPLDSIIRQDSTSSGTNWEIGEREAGKWQIFEDDNDSIVATFQSNGNVGIGTTSPSRPLTINKNDQCDVTIRAANNQSAQLLFGDQAADNQGAVQYNNATDSMSLKTNGGTRMLIASNGFLGLGTSSPTSISGAAGPVFDMQGPNPEIVFHDNSGTANAMSIYYINDIMVFRSNTNSHSSHILYANGNATFAGTLTESGSDERIKKNITPIANATDKLKTLRGVEFDWDEDVCPFKGHEVGLIAQEVEKIIPSAVKPAPFDIDAKEDISISGKDYKTVQYNKIVPLLVQTIKELEARIKTLEDA